MAEGAGRMRGQRKSEGQDGKDDEREKRRKRDKQERASEAVGEARRPEDVVWTDG